MMDDPHSELEVFFKTYIHARREIEGCESVQNEHTAIRSQMRPNESMTSEDEEMAVTSQKALLVRMSEARRRIMELLRQDEKIWKP
jgi:hypothetical protein